MSRAWKKLLPADLPTSELDPEWLVLSGQPNDAGVIELPAIDSRELRAFVTVDMDVEASPKQVVERTWAALDFVSDRLEPHDGRVRPLIGIPLAGTGYGGRDTRPLRSSGSC